MTISVNMMLKIHGRFEIPHVWIGENPDLNGPHLEIIRLYCRYLYKTARLYKIVLCKGELTIE